MRWARAIDTLLRTYPGYTLRTLLAEDAHDLLALRALTDEKLGEDDADDE